MMLSKVNTLALYLGKSVIENLNHHRNQKCNYNFYHCVIHEIFTYHSVKRTDVSDTETHNCFRNSLLVCSGNTFHYRLGGDPAQSVSFVNSHDCVCAFRPLVPSFAFHFNTDLQSLHIM